jgi:spore coat protein U-like protein
MKNIKMSKLALAISAMVMASGAWAANDTSTMAASAAVAAECAVGNGGGIAFGSLSMLNLVTAAQTSADSTAASTFPAICTNGTSTPTFTYGSANALAATDFRLIGTTDPLVFIAYTPYPSADATGTAIVGAGAVAHPGFAADGTTKTLALSAKILAVDKQAKLVQAYSDTITITASWAP